MIPTVQDIASLPVDKLPPLVHVPPVTKPFDVSIRPPGSKSLTNRALLLAALAEGESVLTGALADADDAQVMVRALRQLGAEIDVTPEVEPNGESCGNATIRVKGVGGRWKIKPGEKVTLNLNNAGTATRFLTATAALQPPESGGIVVDGNARMRERPIGELVDKLRLIGVRIDYLERDGRLPLHVRPGALRAGTRLTLDAFDRGRALKSSQTLSAILLLAPWVATEVCIVVPRGRQITSSSYVLMTAGLLAAVGRGSVSVATLPQDVPDWYVQGGRGLSGFDLRIEPDASGASSFMVAASMFRGSRITLDGLPAGGLQGDTRFYSIVEEFGGRARTPRDAGMSITRIAEASVGQAVDLANMPDTAMAAAVLASFATGRSTLSGLRTLRVKETDRVHALEAELAKAGVHAAASSYVNSAGDPDEQMVITPPTDGIDCSPNVTPIEFDTYDDHRMAMSLALIGLRRPNVFVRDPGCVRKTYPTFWRDLAKLYG